MYWLTFMPDSAIKPSRRPTALSEADYGLLAAFRQELREFLHFSEHAARAAGVRPQQHQAMLAIRGAPQRDRVTVGELAQKLKIKHHSAVELAARMEAAGLLAKAGDSADRRRVLIRLTARGERALKDLSAAHKAELARIGPALQEILTHLGILS
jgi:DNA-binding MarR family transcriptional regulator